jgi:hypothetical protein
VITHATKDLATYTRDIFVLDSMIDYRKEFFPEIKEFTFSGYKNPGFTNILKDHGIPFDGSHSMVKITTNWNGWSGFDDLLRCVFVPMDQNPEETSFDFLQLYKDPRGKNHSEWWVVTTDQAERIKRIAHIYGAREYIQVSKITNGREAMGNYGVVVGYDDKCDAVEFVCPRCTDNHQLMSEFMGQPWNFLNCKDVVVIDPFGFDGQKEAGEFPGWDKVIEAAASFDGAGESE